MLTNRALRTVLTLLVFLIDLVVWGGDTLSAGHTEFNVWVLLCVGALAYGCLVIWRSPVPGYLAMLALAAGGLVLPAAESFAGFLFALFLMARLTPRRYASAALAGAVIPVAVNTYTGLRFHPDDPLTLSLLSLGLWVILIVGVWIAGRTLARTDRRIVTERQWAEAATEEARAMERVRISRDLHDTVAHALTGMILQIAGLRAAQKQADTNIDVDEVLANVQHSAEQSMRELHRLLGMLRSADHDDGSHRPHGLTDIPDLITAAQESGLSVTSLNRGTPGVLDPSLEHTAYRVVQEGLSNAMKHAGEGAHVEISQQWQLEHFTVTVRSSNGLLSDTSTVSGGYGLIGLRERVSVSGGTLDHGPTTNGYILQAVLPTAQSRPFVESHGDTYDHQHPHR